MHFFQDFNIGGTNMSIRSTYAWISSTLSVNPFAVIYLSLLFVNVSEVGIKNETILHLIVASVSMLITW
jgi:hypothetical protein